MRVSLQTGNKAAPPPSFTPTQSRLLQRKCACGDSSGLTGECGECSKKQVLQRQSANQSEPSTVPPIVNEVLRSPGQPLDPLTRALMEPHFGHDFSLVRVHTDEQAASSAQAVSALAYTVGNDVVFGAGQYAPRDLIGRQLLAHELTHVVQQKNNSKFQLKLAVGTQDSEQERQADAYSKNVTDGSQQTGVALSLGADSEQSGECKDGHWVVGYDGCSVPDSIADALGIDKDNPAGGRDTHFATKKPSDKGGKACDRHDECYQSCNLLPGAKSLCDSRMYADMVLTCLTSSEGAGTKAKCLSWAETYYLGLVLGGGPAYVQRQAQVCSCSFKRLFF